MSNMKTEIEKRLEILEKTLGSIGVSPIKPVEEATRPEDRADYVAFGSPEHAAFLCLGIARTEEEAKRATSYGVVHKGKSGDFYYLTDELTPIALHRELRPVEAIDLVLRGKVSSFESGPPPDELQSEDPGKPNYAPTMWEPNEEFEMLRDLGLPR